MEHPKQTKRESLKTLWREKRAVTLVYIFLRTSVLLVLLAQIFNRNFENVFLCVLTLILFTMPSLLERKLDIDLPNTLEIIILLFIYAAEILGEIGAYYVTFPNWDTVLHTMNGFLCAAIGFFPVGYPEPQQPRQVPSFSPLSGHCCVLFFHDGGSSVGVL